MRGRLEHIVAFSFFNIMSKLCHYASYFVLQNLFEIGIFLIDKTTF